MGLFDGIKRLLQTQTRETQRERQGEAIRAFWAYWRDAEAELFALMGEDVPEKVVEQVSDAVHAIHPDMAWTFGPGQYKLHSFTLSGEGQAELRVIAERWRAAAPEGARFDFFTSRPAADEDSVMSVQLRSADGPDIDFEGFQIAAERDEDRRLVHVVVFHPAFWELPEQERARATFLALDHALGEADVERWLGSIETTATLPPVAVDLLGLRAEIAEVSALEAAWVVAQVEDDGPPLFLTTCPSLKRWDHPYLDTSCQVVFPYAGGENGLPTEDLESLFGELEDELMRLADASEGIEHFARLTGRGERRNFFYVDGAGLEGARIQAWADARGGNVRVEIAEDPAWELLPRV
ncbi:MAG: DUF695 domain-containing protein [Myxococcota bacterium]